MPFVIGRLGVGVQHGRRIGRLVVGVQQGRRVGRLVVGVQHGRRGRIGRRSGLPHRIVGRVHRDRRGQFLGVGVTIGLFARGFGIGR